MGVGVVMRVVGSDEGGVVSGAPAPGCRFQARQRLGAEPMRYGRAVASSKSLSRSEASRVIDELLQFQGGEHEDEGNRWPIQDADDAKPRPVR